jgi:hypothetical protein
MIKTRPKYPTDLYDNIYIDNIQKDVICLIIPTTFPYEAASSTIIHFSDVTLDPDSKGNIVGMIRKMNIIDVNIIIQVRRVTWSGLYHTGSLLK